MATRLSERQHLILGQFHWDLVVEPTALRQSIGEVVYQHSRLVDLQLLIARMPDQGLFVWGIGI